MDSFTESWMKKCSWCTVDAGLLVLRIGVAGIFILSGYMKVAAMGMTVTQFGSMGFAPFWAYLVTAVELLGGIAVLLGAWTRTASALLTIIMIVAVWTIARIPGIDTMARMGMIMTPIAVFFSSLALTLAGAGKHAVMKE